MPSPRRVASGDHPIPHPRPWRLRHLLCLLYTWVSPHSGNTCFPARGAPHLRRALLPLPSGVPSADPTILSSPSPRPGAPCFLFSPLRAPPPGSPPPPYIAASAQPYVIPAMFMSFLRVYVIPAKAGIKIPVLSPLETGEDDLVTNVGDLI